MHPVSMTEYRPPTTAHIGSTPRKSEGPGDCRALRLPTGPRSEGDRALDHQALELAAVADVGRREVVVLLVHVLDLGQEARGDEPATGEGVLRHADVLRHRRGGGAEEHVGADRVVAIAGVEL